MTAEDFRRIEASLGVSLPARYRSLVLGYSLNPGDTNSQIALLDTAEEVIAL